MKPLVLIALLATPAAAQDIPFDPAPLAACVQTASSDPALRGCIGTAAGPCTETEAGGSTAGMGFCFGAERDWWDALLNDAYGQLLAMEQRAEADAKSGGYTAPATLEPLRQMQRTWISFRDASCEYEYAQWGGGTGGPVAHAACTMRMTGEQAITLALSAKQRGNR